MSALSQWLKITSISPILSFTCPLHVQGGGGVLKESHYFFSLIYSLGLNVLSLMINLIFLPGNTLSYISCPWPSDSLHSKSLCKTICLTQPQPLEKQNLRFCPSVWPLPPDPVNYKKGWDSFCHWIINSFHFLKVKRHFIKGRDQFSRRRSTVPFPDQNSRAVVSHLKTRLSGLANKNKGHRIKFKFPIKNTYFFI